MKITAAHWLNHCLTARSLGLTNLENIGWAALADSAF